MTLPPITRASANDDQAVIRPTTSINTSMRSANRSPGAGSTTGPDLAVIDGFAVTRPEIKLGHVGHVRVVAVPGHRVARDCLGQDLGVGLAKRSPPGVGQGCR